ncbi:uncharacterized protein LOC130625833 [Hydractinia symbiolongicarpus]|uniref:uncharacterized protein LOC130625833 n=1 Tax=Hydractinia symbiolongicarpus TaxID=13093 RepID=UPI00255037EF|nr:uncharacterized protein LOC130625833 [Hydractinia symbiolongicarpus]
MCKDCGGEGICEHERIRSTCKGCKDNQICPHQRVRWQCKECGGNGICKHQRRRSICKECRGGNIFHHEKYKLHCLICDPAGHLANVVRSRNHKSLTKNKELSSREYIGCDMATLRTHIEAQFSEGMTWDHYGRGCTLIIRYRLNIGKMVIPHRLTRWGKDYTMPTLNLYWQAKI